MLQYVIVIWLKLSVKLVHISIAARWRLEPPPFGRAPFWSVVPLRFRRVPFWRVPLLELDRLLVLLKEHTS